MSLGKAGLNLAVLRVINAGLGLALSLSMAAVFGVNRHVDALFVAMAVAVFLGRDLSRVVRTAAVPCLVESGERPEDPPFAESFHLMVLLAALAVTATAWFGAPWIVAITSPGFDAEAGLEAQRLLRILTPSLMLFLLFGAAQGVFHARRQFTVPELGETLWRVIAIVALFTFGRNFGLEAYTLGLTIAALVQWAFLVLAGLRSRIEVLPSRWSAIRLPILARFGLGTLVVLCSVVQTQIEAVLDRSVVSFMEPGSISLFSYAERLARMMPILLSTSLLTPWLPEMARIHARMGDSRQLARQGGLFLSAMGAALALVIMWGARDAVTLLLLRGKFDAASAEIVIVSIRAFCVGLPAIYCVQCIAGLYIVQRDLKAMLWMGVLAVLVHATGNLLLRPWGVPGIALSGSLAVWIVAACLWRETRARETVWFAWRRFAVAMSLTAVVLFAIPWSAFVACVPLRLALGALSGWLVFTGAMWPAIRRMHAFQRQTTGPA